MRTLIPFIFCILCLHFTKAALVPLQYGNYVYETDVRTVQCFQSESGFNLPIAQLGGTNTLALEFDMLTQNQEYFQYTLIHCDYLWNETENLSKNVALSGLGWEEAPMPTFSAGVYSPFAHYRINFPTSTLTPLITGNFLLVVYRNYDPTDIVITRRVMFYNAVGAVDLKVNLSPNVDTRNSHQQVTLTFENTSNYLIPRPQQEMFTVLMQNADWNTAKFDVIPQFITGNKYIYNQTFGNIFPGDNEFRFFDIRSFMGSSVGVRDRYVINNQRHVQLIQDYSRGGESYTRLTDYNGRFLIFNRDLPNLTGNVKTESDYCFVHFKLKSSELTDQRVFVYGELSDWQLQPNFECFYNPTNGCYEAVIQLKQAYYNYKFIVTSGDKILENNPLENNLSATENNYSALIYHKNQAFGYNELIGYGLANSQLAR